MQEVILDRMVYIIENPVLNFVIVFIAGFLATRVISSERRPGIIGFTFIGLIGFFLAQFMISYYQLNDYLDSLLALRIIVDLIAAFIGSFVTAGLVHFIKPS